MQKKYIILLSFFLVLLSTFAYSALSSSLYIDSNVKLRPITDIRVVDVKLNNATNGGSIFYESDFTIDTMTHGFILPNENSTITYNVRITNNGNVDQAIYDLQTLLCNNNDMVILINGQPINEVLPLVVPYGESELLQITYKTNSPSDNVINIINKFIFKRVYYITYNSRGGTSVAGQIKYHDVPLTLEGKPTKDKYVFTGWTDEQNGTTVKFSEGSTYSFNESKILYAIWRQGETTFLPGTEFNVKIKELAGNSGAEYTTEDINITSIVRANTLPQGFTPTEANIVSTSDSDFPIYAWYDNGTIYYYTVVDNPYMNANASHMYQALTKVTSIDVSTINTSRTIDMSYLFHKCFSLPSIDVSNFNTSNVTDMSRMFCGIWTDKVIFMSLTQITGLNNFDTTKVTNMRNMFGYCNKLTSLNISSFNTSNVTNMSWMFVYTGLQTLDLSNFNTSKVTNMSQMFFGCASLTNLDLSNFDMSLVTNTTEMLKGMTLLQQLKTPKVYRSGVTISLPKTLYDSSNNSYTSLTLGNPTETWIKLPYTVKFNSNNGTGTMEDQKIGRDSTTTLTTNTYTREGYTFAGWNTAANGSGTPYLDGASVTNLGNIGDTVNLYAQWIGIDYTVTADSQGGSIPATSGWTGTGNTSTKQVTFGSAYGTLPTPTRTGYTFKGWIKTLDSDLPSGYEQLDYIESTRTQYIDTGYIPKTTTKLELDLSFNGEFRNTNTYGGMAAFMGVADSNTQMFSINFGGGTTERNSIYPWFNKNYQYDGQQAENINITDSIRTNRNTLTIENGRVTYGNVTRTVSNKEVDQTNSMYIFGRRPNQDSSNIIPYFTAYNMRVYDMKIYENDVLVRHYVPVLNTITHKLGLYETENEVFYGNLGTGEFQTEYVTSETVVDINGNHTLYASWEPNKYNIVFDKNNNDATGTMDNITNIEYDSTVSLTTNSYTRTGYTFAGWNTASDGTGTAYLDGASVSNLTSINNGNVTLYAQWIVNTYTVIFDYNGGVKESNNLFKFDGYDQTINGTTHNTTWGSNYLEFNGTNSWVALGEMNSDYMTMEATFSADEYHSDPRYIISNAQTGGGEIYLSYPGYAGGSNRICGHYYINSSYRTLCSNNVYEPNKIYHVILSYDGVKEKLFINGNLEKELSIDGTIAIPQSNTIMILGGDPAGSKLAVGPFQGKIYSAAVYSNDKDTKQVTYDSPYGTLPEPTREGYTFKGWNGKNMFNINSVSGSKYSINNDDLILDGSDVTDNVGTSIKIQKYLNSTYVSESYASDVIGTHSVTITKDSSFNRICIRMNTNHGDPHILYYLNNLEDNTSYIISYNVISFDKENATAEISSIQIEEGTTATRYEPYYITSETTVVQPQNHTLTAIWHKKESSFTTGDLFNKKIKKLANPSETIDSVTYTDTNITSIQRTNSVPQNWIENNEITPPSEDNVVSTSTSEYPIYAWYDNGVIYYYTEALNPKLHSSSSSMFRALSKVESIELDTIDTSNATSLHAMFFQDSSIETIDLSNFNTKNVTDMGYMFSSSTILKSILFGNNYDTSHVTDMSNMFKSCSSLISLDLSTFDMSLVTNTSDILNSMTALRSLKTPNTYPSSDTITLPTTLYDASGNSYSTLDSTSPTSTWLSLQYNLTYDLDGGSVSTANPTTYTYDSSSITLNNPTKEGYTFAGWSGGKNLVNLQVEESNPGDTSFASTTPRTFILNTYVRGLAVNNYYSLNNVSSSSVVINSNSLTFTGSSGYGIGYPLRCKPSTSYNLSYNAIVNNNKGTPYVSLQFYAEDGTHINWNGRNETAGYNIITATAPANAYYVVPTFAQNGSYINITYSNIQLEEGSTVTSYEPYIDKQVSVTIPTGSEGNRTYKAIWHKKEATFNTGQDFNGKIKRLAGNSEATYATTDSNITSIQRANSIPQSWITNDEITPPSEDNVVSTSDSEYPIYAWYDTGVVYYYTEALNPYMNETAISMFTKLERVTLLDINTLDTSKTTNMSNLFYDCKFIETLDLSNFDTSNVTNMYAMFSDCFKLENLNIKSFNTSNVTTMQYMFQLTQKLKKIDVSSFDTSKVLTMNSMFKHNTSESLDISNFDMSLVTDTTNMLSSNSSLRSLKTPNTYPSDTTVTIKLPITLSDTSGNSYSTLDSTSPTSTWLGSQYTVTYDNNGGLGIMSNQNIVVDAPTELTTNTYTREGYTFKEWRNQLYYSTQEKTSNSGEFIQYVDLAPYFDQYGTDVTYHLELDLKSKDVSNNSIIKIYNMNNERSKYSFITGDSTNHDMYNITVTSTEFTHVSFDFKIKLKNNGETESNLAFFGTYGTGNIPIVKNVELSLLPNLSDGQTVTRLGDAGDTISLKAQWEANKYNIVFDKNDEYATGTMESITNIEYDESITLTENSFTKTGYTFTGWNTEPDGTGTPYLDEASVSNLSSTNNANVTLYAQWLGNTYTATYYYNTDTTSGSTSIQSTTRSCTVTNNEGNCTVEVPTVSTVGKYNSTHIGYASGLSNMNTAIETTDTTVTLTNTNDYYAIYQTPITIYYPDTSDGISSSNTALYRNEYFTSSSEITSITSVGTNTTQATSATINNAKGTVTGLNANTGNEVPYALSSPVITNTNESSYYATVAGNEDVVFHYNSNTTSGSFTDSTVNGSAPTIYYCNTSSEIGLTHGVTSDIPEAVSNSIGKYNSEYKGISSSNSSIVNATTFTGGATYYAYYSTAVTIYYPTATIDTSTGALSNLARDSYSYYRNEFYSSASSMTSVINSTQTSTTNISISSGVSGYSLYGFANSTSSSSSNYGTVSSLAKSNKTISYAVLRKGITATVYYNSGSGDGTLAMSTKTTSTAYRYLECTSSSATMYNSQYSVPSAVSSSVGQYGNKYYDLSQSLNSMSSNRYTASSSSSAGADVTALYAIYSGNNVSGTTTNVTNYYYGSSYTSRILYRNSFFTSVSSSGTMNTVLATSSTGTSNYSTAAGSGSSVWSGLSTLEDTTEEYSTVDAAAKSTSTTLYTVYSFSITYQIGSNVSSIDKMSDNCKITSSTSCNVTLPTITSNLGYTSVGWNTTNGATTGTSEGVYYSINSNPTILYANAIDTSNVTYSSITFSESSDMIIQNVIDGVATPLRLNTFTKAGFDFDYWLDPDNNITYRDGEIITLNDQDILLSAQWKKAAGLYDSNDNLIKTWPELEALGLTKTAIETDYTDSNYKTETTSPYTILTSNNLSGKLLLPNTITKIGSYAFAECSSLTEVEMPDSLTTIENFAFYSATGLTQVDIPKNVTSIGTNPFASCTGVESMTVDDNNTVYFDSSNNIAKRYDYSIVSGCKNSTISMPFRYIADYAFYGIQGLYSSNDNLVVITRDIRSIGNYAFYGTDIEELRIGSKTIGDYAFANCTQLERIYLYDDLRFNTTSLTTIGNYAFYGTTNIIASLEIPNTVTTIGDYAFSKSSLPLVTIGSGVTTIGYRAFYRCNQLTSARFLYTYWIRSTTNSPYFGTNITVSTSSTSSNASVLKGSYYLFKR